MIEINKSKISCPIFQAKEELVLADLIKEVNESLTTNDGAFKLEELKEELEELLRCPEFSDSAPECKNCRIICKLRQNLLQSALSKISSNI